MPVHVTSAQVSDPNVSAMLQSYVRELREHDLLGTDELAVDELRGPDVLLWAAWVDGRVVGVVALTPVEAGHAELRSMLVVRAARRQGVGAALLARVLADAEEAGIHRISLEIGREDYFEGARHLYRRTDFVETGPFGTYRASAESVFMTREF